MRSFLTRAALAAVLLTTAAGTAFAASDHDHDRGRDGSMHEHDGHHNDRFHARANDDPDPSTMVPDPEVTGSIPTTNGRVMAMSMQKPRLATVMRELRVDARRIARDRARGELNTAELRAVNAEKSGIRSEAVRVAEAHRGAIPAMRFASLQQEVRQLGATIHELSTNRA